MGRTFIPGTAFLALLSFVGCNGPELPGSLHRSIFYGTEDTQPSHAAVVAITWGPQWGYFCSGTLIHERFVLTAAHCLEGEVANEVEVFFGLDTNDGSGQYVGTSTLIMHEGYDGWEADIGLVELAAPAPAGFTPLPHLPEALKLTSADVGAAVDYSGYGLTETGEEGVRLHVAGTILKVCAGPGWCDGGDIVPHGFYFSMAEGGPCTGDSGGPTFLFRNNFEYVAGVTSYGDEDCIDYGVNTTVSDYADWIENHLPMPTIEVNCDNGIDDDGDDDVDCEDSDCNCDHENPDAGVADTDGGGGTDGDGGITSNDGGAGGDDGGGGCCRTSSGDDAPLWLLALVAPAWWRRRRAGPA